MVGCFRLEKGLKPINQECIFLLGRRCGFRAGRGRGKDVVVTASCLIQATCHDRGVWRGEGLQRG